MSSDSTFIEALQRNPTDEATWAVWLDRLRDRSDPVAEVADAPDAEALARALETHAPGWFGRDVSVRDGGEVTTFEGDRDTTGVVARFRRGHIEQLRVVIDWDGEGDSQWSGQSWIPDMLGWLLKQPVARLVTDLEVRVTPNSEFFYEGLIEAITATAPLAVRRMYVGDDDQLSWTNVPNIRTLWTAAPFLESLTCQGSEIALGAPNHAHLEELELVTGGLPAEPVAVLGAADLPALKNLELWFGSSNYGAACDVPDVLPLLGRAFPALQRAGLVNCEFTDRLLDHLHEAVWLPQLRELALFGSILTDAGAERLLANAEAYAHLERIDLHDHYLSTEMMDRLQQRFGAERLDLAGQQTPSRWGDQDHYYVSVGE